MMAYTERVRLVLTADSRVLVTCVPANGMLSMWHGYISVGQFNNSQEKNKSENKYVRTCETLYETIIGHGEVLLKIRK